MGVDSPFRAEGDKQSGGVGDEGEQRGLVDEVISEDVGEGSQTDEDFYSGRVLKSLPRSRRRKRHKGQSAPKELKLKLTAGLTSGFASSAWTSFIRVDEIGPCVGTQPTSCCSMGSRPKVSAAECTTM